jgi:hypothetical protein
MVREFKAQAEAQAFGTPPKESTAEEIEDAFAKTLCPKTVEELEKQNQVFREQIRYLVERLKREEIRANKWYDETQRSQWKLKQFEGWLSCSPGGRSWEDPRDERDREARTV